MVRELIICKSNTTAHYVGECSDCTPWGRWHFLRHWIGVAKIIYGFEDLGYGDWLFGRCNECGKVVDQF